MKKIKILILVIVLISISGCASLEKNDEKNKSQEISENYVSSMVDIKNQAEKNIQKAATIKNNQIKNAMNENEKNNLEYVKKYKGAVLNTNFGKIELSFYGEESPVTVNNFLKLSSEGFYDGTKFHRVIADFMIQGGDPNSKDDDFSNDGMGGPGYSFKDEFNSFELVRGSLAMANSGPNTNGSQFFVVTAKSTPWLDGKHTNFGKVVSGMEVVSEIEKVKTNQNDHPLKDVVIENIDLIEK